MKNKMIITLLLLVLMLTACGEKKENLTGVWIEQQEDGSSESMHLYSDGTGIITDYDTEGNIEGNYSCTWITENGYMKVTVDYGIFGTNALSYKYEVKDDTICFWDDSGEQMGTYVKEEK